jgi:anti-sigma regulatory factor (Ser/Thr protein kinase)
VLVAQRCGLDDTRVGEVALIATEAGTNAIRHGDKGAMVIGLVIEGDRKGVVITVCDRGVGMDVARSLSDGVSSIGSSGAGLGAIARMASEWDAYSRRPGGTVITATVWPRRGVAEPRQFELGAVAVPFPGERRCGDGWTADLTRHVCTVLVSDGLGHGDPAAEATASVLASFRARPHAPLEEIFERADATAHHTRGAAVSVVRIDRLAATVTFAGMGNVAGWIISDGQQKAMVGQHGTVGQTIRKVRESVYPLPPRAMVVLHSDGLVSRWNLADYGGIERHSAATIAGFLWRELGRDRDDATVVVIRPIEATS